MKRFEEKQVNQRKQGHNFIVSCMNTKRAQQFRRRVRVRARISGTTLRPRLTVHRSLVGLFAQVIDDTTGKTIVGLSSAAVGAVKADEKMTRKVAEAYALGTLVAEKAKEANIHQVVFDRAHYRYHGRVKAFAEGARSGGLEF